MKGGFKAHHVGMTIANDPVEDFVYESAHTAYGLLEEPPDPGISGPYI